MTKRRDNFNKSVAINACDRYDADVLKDILIAQFHAVGVKDGDFAGKRVVIKPNLVAKRSPEVAATTHPAMLEAAVYALRSFGADDITLAESPGGPYVEAALRLIYDGCGMTKVAEKCGIKLNFDTSYRQIPYPDGVMSKVFNIITPVAECDVLIDLCKLKAHTLTKMSCAVKNLFGVVPGVQKFETHARFPVAEDFCGFIADLCACVCSRCRVIAVCDAVTGMEGNGPTGGEPRDIGAVLCSADPFYLDTAAAGIIGFDDIPMLKIASERGFCPLSTDGIDVIGDRNIHPDSFKAPDSYRFSFLRSMPTLFGGAVARIFEPHPEVDKNKCVGCGECVRSCPVKTITLCDVDGGKKRAEIHHDKCIKCFCCQELCPFKAVKVKRNFLIKLVR